MKEVVVLLAADLSIQEIYNQHEELLEGSGEQFIEQITLAFQQLSQFPASAPVYWRDVRRLVLVRTPYLVLYRIEARGVMVYDVIHSHQDLDAVIQRLGL